MAKVDDAELLEVVGRMVRVSSPSKPYFTRGVQLTKLDIVRYFLAVAPGALRGIVDRPVVLKRFVNGAEAEPFYQKRAPSDLPEWMRTVTLSFPSGRTAEEVVVDDAAGLAWIVNLGCMELHPHPVRTGDLDHPDELRVDLDPQPGVVWTDVRAVAMEVKALLDELGLVAWPKTSGSRGIHINIRIEPRWTFTEVRRAALALARAVEKRCSLASSKWWKEERHGVFLDYNQNAKDRTTCSAYSVRPLPDARVSTPLRWDEVMTCDPADFTVLTMPDRFAKIGDPHAAMNEHAGVLDALLEMAARDEAEGVGDAPWPPHFRKMEGEPARVQPSKSRTSAVKKTVKKKITKAVGEDVDLADPVAKKGRRQSTMPLIVIAQSPDKAAAEAGLERWKQQHPEAAALLAPDDVLVDRMRGSAYVWYRIRVNLRHVPEESRPAQGVPDPDDDPTRAWRESKEQPS
ncbi:DNA polymerase domain-containing protein [Tunturibacter empetritectus]|uniref:DNA ligase D-like protein (Predicted polymerase) n=1 Tax=Tunturiibacter lichenicola TaxID=2051959 RepID=A0A7W8JB66_9BACT|nr:DNA primase small subunit domain-containing protein [Edaphobacter lichenicola]MBB5344742.1 DNA ligase D-like protein (predicted polymerase) [Edaphobacter lichenicola]